MSCFFKTIFLPLLCAFILLSASAEARIVTGKVTHVFDGDSFNLRTSSGKKHEVRLYGIDCPEKGQPYSNSARKFTRGMVDKKEVSIDVFDVDQYRRLVGVVRVDDVVVNKKLLESGLAWQYGRYCNELFCRDWKKLETRARQNRTGLWRDKNPIPPWKWRYQQRADKENQSLKILVKNIFDWLLRLIA